MLGIFLLMIAAASWTAILCRVVFLMKEHGKFTMDLWNVPAWLLEVHLDRMRHENFMRNLYSIGYDPGAPGGDHCYTVTGRRVDKEPMEFQSLPYVRIHDEIQIIPDPEAKPIEGLEWVERVLNIVPTKEKKDDN